MSKEPRFHYRVGANQPAASPTAKRLVEMAGAIARDTKRLIPGPIRSDSDDLPCKRDGYHLRSVARVRVAA